MPESTNVCLQSCAFTSGYSVSGFLITKGASDSGGPAATAWGAQPYRQPAHQCWGTPFSQTETPQGGVSQWHQSATATACCQLDWVRPGAEPSSSAATTVWCWCVFNLCHVSLSHGLKLTDYQTLAAAKTDYADTADAGVSDVAGAGWLAPLL